MRVPALVRDTQAVFAEPLAAACGVLERCPEAAAGKVAVLGDGKLGLLCARVLAAHGGRPLLVGKHPEKLARAAQSGIETSDLAAARRRGRAFDVVVEVENLISDTVPLSRAEQALEEAATPGALKVLLQAG